MSMDDADGGARGLRPTPTADLFDTVQEKYGLESVAEAVDLGGSSSLNLLVRDGAGCCVVHVYRPHVTAARLADIGRVRAALSAGGVPCAEPVMTRDGQSSISVGGCRVEVEPYVAHDAVMDTGERLEIGLPVLGRMHTILRSIVVSSSGRHPPFANHIESGDALLGTRRGTNRIRAWNPSPAERHLADAADALARLVASVEAPLVPDLPRQLVHGDFWDNNVLFQAGRVTLVADFDFLGERARIDDLALTLYFAAVEHLPDPASDNLSPLRRLLQAYDRDLHPPLSGAERAALPFAIARQPLWSFAVWVARLDDEDAARRHAAGMALEVDWALRLMENAERWQAAFA